MGAKPHPNRDAALKDYAETDMSVKEIAEKHGVAVSTISSWATQRALSRPGKSRDELTNGEWVRDDRGVMRWVPNG